MDLTRLVLAQALTFACVVSRIGGFVAVAPLPGAQVPPTQRVGLALVLAWAASIDATPAISTAELGARWIAASGMEVGIGVVIGLGFRVTTMVGETAGALYAHASGLGTPSVYDPSIDAQETALGRAVTLLSLLLALSVGAHRVAIGYLLESFHALPIGSAVSLAAPAPILVELLANGLAEGVRLAMPLIGMSLVTQIALALVARVAPSMQIFSVGLSVLLLTGLLTALSGLDDLGAGVAADLSHLGGRLDRLLLALGGHGT